MAEPRRRRSVSQTFLLDLLDAQLGQLELGDPRPLDVVDVGGGTGGLAAALASRGHRVTVVDPSPDALASLDRRAAEAGQRIRGVQGDTSDLIELLGAASADVVVCHRVLEVVDSPAESLAAMARALRVGGVLSLLVAQRRSQVLGQALAGHLTTALQTYADANRLDTEQILALVTQAGFEIIDSHGIGAVADHVPESVAEADSESHDTLLALEAEISQDPAFRALAPHLHVFASWAPA